MSNSDLFPRRLDLLNDEQRSALVDLGVSVTDLGAEVAFADSNNNSVVRAHAGSTVVLGCKVRDGARFGMVSDEGGIFDILSCGGIFMGGGCN